MATVVGLQQEPPEDPEAERRWLLEWLQASPAGRRAMVSERQAEPAKWREGTSP